MKRMKDRINNNSGFTLVEVLISVFILSLIVTSASTAFVFSSKTTRDNKIKLTAINLANERVEYIRSLPFAEVGTNKEIIGIVEPEKTQTLDGIDYLIKTDIVWKLSGEVIGSSMDALYKDVKVTVVPQVLNGALTQMIETYVSKQSYEAVAAGGSIAISYVRGWKDPAKSTAEVVPNVHTLLSGPTVKNINSSSDGTALFVGLIPGSYDLEINPSSVGMIMDPKQKQQETWKDINVENMKVTPRDYRLEEPCNLSITFEDMNNKPISFNPDDPGKIILTAGSVILPFGFKASDLDSNGKLSESFCSNIWPYGKGDPSDSYKISGKIGEWLVMNFYEEGSDIQWNGEFDGPGTTKHLKCKMWKAPEIPATVKTKWADDYGEIYRGTFVAPEDIGTFFATKVCSLYVTGRCDYTARYMRFINPGDGTVTNAALYVNTNSQITLHTSYIQFEGWVKFNDNNAKMILRTDGENVKPFQAKDVGIDSSDTYGVIYLPGKMTLLDHNNLILKPGSYLFKDGTVLPDDASSLIPFGDPKKFD